MTGHKLIIESLWDAKARCECGKWFYCCAGEATREQIEHEHNEFHVKPRKQQAARERANALRNARNQVMRDCGLVRVRGELGGVYWE